MMASAASENASRRAPLTPDQRASSPQNKLILLVDDEFLMQELGRELLEEQGYRVIVAGDGLEALELFQQHKDEIALVILDLLMPKLDGGQTYLALKKLKPNVKAFFCTGYTPQEIIGSLLEQESLRALQKPFRPSEFVQVVREMLETN